MTNYYNNTSQEERKRLIAEASKPTTYSKLASLGDDLGGRFREKQTVAGEQPAVNYPTLPASSPWSAGNDAGVEPPTGQDINFVEPCGEAHEIEASLATSSSDPAPNQGQFAQIVGDDGGVVSEVDRGSAPLTANQCIPPQAVAPHPPVKSALRSTLPLPEQPDDGLPDDIARRDDGWPLSNSVETKMKRRKI